MPARPLHTYMFELSFDEVKPDLDEYLDKVQDFKFVFRNGGGDTTAVTDERLYAWSMIAI